MVSIAGFYDGVLGPLAPHHPGPLLLPPSHRPGEEGAWPRNIVIGTRLVPAHEQPKTNQANLSLFSRTGGGRWEKRAGVMRGGRGAAQASKSAKVPSMPRRRLLGRLIALALLVLFLIWAFPRLKNLLRIVELYREPAPASLPVPV